MTICGVQQTLSQKRQACQRQHNKKHNPLSLTFLQPDAKLHRSGFHHREMASVDTLFDILGSISLLDHHGFLEGQIYGTPPVPG